MKKAKTEEPISVEEMRPEYDFSTMKGGVRGKYYKAYREGHKVVVHKEGGTDTVHNTSSLKTVRSCWNRTCESTSPLPMWSIRRLDR